jgi:hypothetical protein
MRFLRPPARQRRRLAALVATAALCTGAPAAVGAGTVQLDPHLTVWLIEPATRSAPPLNAEFTVTATHDWGAFVVTGFHRHGRRRALGDGDNAFYVETRRGGVYPSVALDGRSPVQPCPAVVLCSSPSLGPDVILTFTPQDRAASYYAFVNDTGVDMKLSAGWRRREVRGGKLLQYRDAGTAVRASALYRQYMVEDFHGVSAARADGPSIAFASIPCWFYPVPGGDGRATLTDDGTVHGRWRQMRCDDYWSVGRGASDGPTTWRNDGASLGWSGGFVNRLVVAVLPPE